MIRFLSSANIPAFLNFQSCGLSLLLVYLCTLTFSPGQHSHTLHEHNDHTASTEQDPCHIRIFHPGAEGGCEHKFHFTQYCDDCHDQQITLVRQIVPSSIIWQEIAFAPNTVHDYFTERSFFYSSLLHDDRGPPSADFT